MGDGGTAALFGQIKDIFGQIKNYFNPVGRFYIQFQILCRVLVCTVFLDDLFEGADLECETDQPGCTQNCINRFAPVNHKKIWEAEMFVIMFATSMFTLFTYINRHQYQKFKDRVDKQGGKLEATKSMARFKESGNKKVVKSRYTNFGYIFMLITRLVFEIMFLYIENQISKHQSQKTGFWEAFYLKELWICATNTPTEASARSLDQLLPVANRSEIFWIDDINLACMQQQVTVTCWIPFSRMKSYGMFFMYIVLIVGTVMTALELVVELLRLCFGRKRSKNRESQNNRVYEYSARDTLKGDEHA